MVANLRRCPHYHIRLILVETPRAEARIVGAPHACCQRQSGEAPGDVDQPAGSYSCGWRGCTSPSGRSPAPASWGRPPGCRAAARTRASTAQSPAPWWRRGASPPPASTRGQPAHTHAANAVSRTRTYPHRVTTTSQHSRSTCTHTRSQRSQQDTHIPPPRHHHQPALEVHLVAHAANAVSRTRTYHHRVTTTSHHSRSTWSHTQPTQSAGHAHTTTASPPPASTRGQPAHTRSQRSQQDTHIPPPRHHHQPALEVNLHTHAANAVSRTRTYHHRVTTTSQHSRSTCTHTHSQRSQQDTHIPPPRHHHQSALQVHLVAHAANAVSRTRTYHHRVTTTSQHSRSTWSHTQPTQSAGHAHTPTASPPPASTRG